MTRLDHRLVFVLRTLRWPLIVVAVSLAAEFWVSPFAFYTSILDFAAVSVIFVPAILLGRALLSFFRFHDLPHRWVFVFSAALGLGTLALLILAGGLSGIPSRWLWIAALLAASLAGLVVIVSRRDDQERIASSGSGPALGFIGVPFLTLALLAASHAPGLIWAEEGFGYDVLEYHLQLPREYVQAGRISYLPHNVYASFPSNIEMLYMVGMIVHGESLDFGTTANMMHLCFAALSVIVAWAMGRDVSPAAGVLGALLPATCSWLEYLSGLAYVENGMLFFGLCALGAAMRAFDAQGPEARRLLVVSAVCAGFSAGCKYTALPMIVLPVAICWLFWKQPWPARITNGAAFVVVALIALGPWLVKNAIFTGNPVFPLAGSLLEKYPSGWGPQQQEQWDKGHSLENVSITHRAVEFWQHIPADHLQRFGPAILGLPVLGLFARRRNPIDYGLLTVLIVQILIWLFATHLYARFAVPFLVPLVALGCRFLAHTASKQRFVLIVAVIVGSSLWNLTYAARRHVREASYGVPASGFYEGALAGFEYLEFMNRQLPPESKVLLVGDARPYYIIPATHYCVTFNHNPFFELIKRSSDPKEIIHWLESQRYTHLLVHWTEVRRLARSYGFSPPIGEDELSSVMNLLVDAGLQRVKAFPHPQHHAARYVEVFRVPLELGKR